MTPAATTTPAADPAATTTPSTTTPPAADPAAGAQQDPRYRLVAGMALVDRGRDLQIGLDPPRRILLRNAPDRALDVLSALDGRRSVREAMQSAGDADSDLEWWTDVLARLSAAGFLDRPDRDVIGSSPGGPEAERIHLIHRYGAARAARALARRSDAVVEVRGAGRVACTVALQLAAVGVGHVHQVPDRPVRRGDPLPPLASTSATRSDQDALADRLRSVSERVVARPSATHQRPTLIVLAADGAPDSSLARDLVVDGIPHLSVWAGPARAVVGPLVLPGRSSCLWCADLSRTDQDDGWPSVLRTAHRRRSAAPGVLAAGAAVLACAEVLDHLEGLRRPSTVDGTLEWDLTRLPRRRSWSRHPRCDCAG